jgi:hypothetical protein
MAHSPQHDQRKVIEFYGTDAESHEGNIVAADARMLT